MTDIPNRLVIAVNGLLNRYLVRSADGRERPIPYNPVDYQTLRVLGKQPDIRASDIATWLGTPSTTMQSALDRLVRRGLIEKQISQTDGRARIYRLSSKGHTILTTIIEQDRANMADMIEPLSPNDREKLAQLLDQITKL